MEKLFKFRSVKALQAKFDEYFQDRDKKQLIYAVTGLVSFLDINRQTLINYRKSPGYKKLFHTIKKAENNKYGLSIL